MLFEAEQITIAAAVMDDMGARIRSSIVRMNKIQKRTDAGPKSEAMDMFKRSDDSLQIAIASFEEATADKAMQRRPAVKFVRSSLNAALNTIDSVVDGMEEGEVRRKRMHAYADEIRTNLQKALAQLQVFRVEQMQVAADVEASGEVAEDVDGRSNLTEVVANSNYKLGLQKVIETLKLSKQHEPKPKKGQPFFLLRMPVIPLMQKMVDPDKLHKAGIPVAGAVGHYIALADQLVIAVDPKQLPDGTEPGEYAKEIMSVVGQKKGVRLIMPMDEPAQMLHTSTPFIYFWMMGEHEWDRLNHAVSRGSEVGLFGWGVPL